MKTILILIAFILIMRYAIPFIIKGIKQYRTMKSMRTLVNGMTENLENLGQEKEWGYEDEEFIVPNNLSETQNLDPKWNKGVVRGKNGRFMKKQN